MSDHDKDRAIEMLLVAAKYIEDHWPEGLIEYDGTDCDGYCVAEDCRNAAEAIGWDGGESEG